MTQDAELTAIAAAYEALKALPPAEWARAVRYLGNRLAENERGNQAKDAAYLDMHLGPTWFCEGALTEGIVFCDAREEVVDNSDTGYLEPIEVCGFAVVSQQFAVTFPIGGDEDDVVDRETEWFASRAEAEHFIADLES